MEIRKYKCKRCNIEHIDKIYENKSEALADIFVEASFKKIWGGFREKHKDMPMEDFCREFVFEYIYHFHRNLKRIRVDKESIKPVGNHIENSLQSSMMKENVSNEVEHESGDK